jgi:membrane protein
MARLREAKQVIGAIGIKEFSRRVWQQVGEDDVFTWAASLAYSWMFAIFPFLIFLLTLVPLLPKSALSQAGTDIHDALRNLPKNAADPIQQQADDLLHKPQSSLLSVGLIVTIWAASGGMSMTMTALDRCYDIRQGRSYLWHRLVAIVLTICSATLVILVMILLPVASAVIAWLEAHDHHLGPIVWVLNLSRFAVALLLMLGLLALVYRWGISIKVRFRFVTPGALFSVAVWLVLAVAFRSYINRFGAASYNKTYGAVAGVAILLLFFYIDAAVLLIGAEINSEVDFAMLGLPSFDDVEVHQFERHHTDEHRELLRQLKAKRDIAPAAPPATPPAISSAEALAPTRKHALQAISLFATAGAAWAFFKAIREARHASFEKARLRELHPETYRTLFEGDGLPAPPVEGEKAEHESTRMDTNRHE